MTRRDLFRAAYREARLRWNRWPPVDNGDCIEGPQPAGMFLLSHAFGCLDARCSADMPIPDVVRVLGPRYGRGYCGTFGPTPGDLP